jgi:MoaA/NifB/PqqE/SkfB family radical SAM enzyme
MKYNVDELYDYVCKMADMGVDAIVLDGVSGFPELAVSDKDQLKKIYDQIERAKLYLNSRKTMLEGPLIRKFSSCDEKEFHLACTGKLCKTMKPSWGKTLPACGSPWESIMISVDGDVCLCCINERKLGSVKSSTIESIWNDGSEYMKIRDELVSGKLNECCRNCLETDCTSDCIIPKDYWDRWAYSDYAKSESKFFNLFKRLRRMGMTPLGSMVCLIPLSSALEYVM